jgi:hypothetical protein
MPRYTKHHYIATAKAIYLSGARGKALASIVASFADLYGSDNPQFRAYYFNQACTLGLIRQRRGTALRSLLDSSELCKRPLSRKALRLMSEDAESIVYRRLARRRERDRARRREARTAAREATLRLEYDSEGI